MSGKISLSPASIKKSIVGFLHRFHVVIFVIVVFGGAAAVVFTLNDTFARSTSDDGYEPKTNDIQFDQATVDRIESLRTRTQSGDNTLNLPDGRTNPFVE